MVEWNKKIQPVSLWPALWTVLCLQSWATSILPRAIHHEWHHQSRKHFFHSHGELSEPKGNWQNDKTHDCLHLLISSIWTVLHTLWITILYTDQAARSHTYCVLVTTSINMHILTQLSSEFSTEKTCVENRVRHLAALLLSTFFFKTILSWPLWNLLARNNTHLNYIFTIHQVTVFYFILPPLE